MPVTASVEVVSDDFSEERFTESMSTGKFRTKIGSTTGRYLRSIAIAASVMFLGLMGSAHAVEIYDQETSGGARTYVTFYGISKSWNTKCTRQMSGRGKGTAWCELTATDGTKYASGHYKTITPAPRLEIWNPVKRSDHAEIDFGYKRKHGTPFKVQIGQQSFEGTTRRSNINERPPFEDKAANELIEAMRKGTTLHYAYNSMVPRYERGSVSLIGFTAAMAYANNFLGTSY